MQTSESNQNLAAALVVGGGLIAAISAVLSWIDFSETGQADLTYKGTDLQAGSGTVFLGLVLLVIGAILYVRGGRSGGRGASITAIVIAAFALLFSVYTAVAPGDSLVQFEAEDLAEFYDISESQAESILETGFETGDLEAKALIGPWVAAAGGLLALIGGIVGVAASGKIKAARAAAIATPPGSPPPPEA